MRCLRYPCGIALVGTIVLFPAVELPPALAAPAQSAHAALVGTWRLDPARSTEDPADWRRLGAHWRRTIFCLPNFLTQNDLETRRHLHECETPEPLEMDGVMYRGPETKSVASTLGTTLVSMAAEIVIDATATVAVITGGPGAGAMTFSTLNRQQTQRVADHAIRVRARWRHGALEQTLAGKDHDRPFRVLRVFRPAADGQSLTIDTRVEAPRLEPRVKNITRVYTRVR